MLILEHLKKVLETWQDDVHVLKLFWALCDCSKSDNCRIALLPVLVLDVLRHKRDHWADDVVTDH